MMLFVEPVSKPILGTRFLASFLHTVYGSTRETCTSHIIWHSFYLADHSARRVWKILLLSIFHTLAVLSQPCQKSVLAPAPWLVGIATHWMHLSEHSFTLCPVCLSLFPGNWVWKFQRCVCAPSALLYQRRTSTGLGKPRKTFGEKKQQKKRKKRKTSEN